MSALPDQPAPWSARRWVTTVLLITAAQVGCIWVLSSRHLVVEPRRAPETQLRLIQNLKAVFVNNPLNAPTDPTLFALVHPHGFSAEAWLRPAPQQNELLGWTEPSFQLQPNAERLGNAVGIYLKTNSVPTVRLANRVPTPVTGLAPVPSSLPTRSTIRVVNAPGNRQLVRQPELPTIPANEALPPSVVRLSVDAKGATDSAILLSSSGQPAADAQALSLASTLQFTPAPAGAGNAPTGLTWITVEFRWMTVSKPSPTF